MAKKYVLFSLDDEKAKNLGDTIANDTSRRIANFLADKEASESEISKELNMPLNTVGYNIKKLIKAGLIEEKKHFFSEKGKRIPVYKVANKLIVLAVKKNSAYSKLKSVIPVVLVSSLLAFFIAFYQSGQFVNDNARKVETFVREEAVVGALEATDAVSNGIVQTMASQPIWLWFLIGSLVTVIGFLIWNWKKL